MWHIESPASHAQPVVLADWFVFETPGRARHAVGSEYRYYGRDSRITTAIDGAIDLPGASFRTKSGRQYQLAGPPGMNGDGDYLLNRWLEAHGLEMAQLSDISRDLWNATVETANLPPRPF